MPVPVSQRSRRRQNAAPAYSANRLGDDVLAVLERLQTDASGNGLPFEMVVCLRLAVTGWLIATWHRDARVAVVIFGALSSWLWAVPWARETGRLWEGGLWPFWDYRLALLFKAALLFVGYPLFILIGGLRSERSDAISA